ncbi:hypothetical protein [Rhizobium leguminosarum]|uniref:hypothetical protein n=1 Tax=Rhizobium leguminosarum TaxID=384 RepID=UPI0015FB400C|nr:hypothetical protein [Rhizobium leguminosarum]MBA8835159.1 hypothetical protein [Rhizobium leguminosarum]
MEDYEAVLERVARALPILSDTVPRSLESLNGAAHKVAEVYPELLKHQFYDPKSTFSAVVKLLNDQIVGGNIERLRGGKLGRRIIADRLGVHKSAMAHYLEIFHDYEAALGGLVPNVEAKIPALRAWLRERMRRGILEVFDGKLHRQLEGELFGIKQLSSDAARYPLLGKLLDEIDEEIVKSGYKGRGVEAKLETLRALLAGRPVLNKDKLTISRPALSAASGITVSKLSRSPYSLEIRAAEKAIIRSLEKDPLVLLVEGRVLEFHPLLKAGWQRTYVVALAERFCQVFAKRGKIAARSHLSALIEFLTYISSSSSPHCLNLFKGIADGISVRSLEADFDRVGIEFSNEMSQRYSDFAYRQQRLSLANSVVRHMSGEGLLPRLSIRLRAQDGPPSSHIRTVAEAVEKSVSVLGKPSVDDYLAYATMMLDQASGLREIQLERGDQSAFRSLLRAELNDEPYMAADNPATLILRVLNRRLDLIKAAAVLIVDEAIHSWERGQHLLDRGIDPGERFDKLLATYNRSHEYVRLLNAIFPNDGGEQGLADLLKVVSNRYNLMYPVNPSGKLTATNFFTHRAQEHGGTRKLQSYLTPSSRAVSAVLTLYLLESGSNVSVGRTLFYDCVEDTEEPHHSKITGFKARAQGKPIFAVMENRCDALRAVRWLQNAVGKIPQLDTKTKPYLFVARTHRQSFKLIEDSTYRTHFKELVASIPELAKLQLSPRMLRPSILLRAALESDGRVRLSQAIGQHGRTVHEGYVNRYPTRFLRDAEVRHFQHSYETLVISNIENVHSFLGVGNDSLGERIEGLMKTGLGTFCRDRTGRPGQEGTACKSMDCWNDCPQLIVIAEKSELAILQIWQHSLRQVEGDWVRDQPERWEMVWLPWLCFLDAVEMKMRQSFGPVWRDAELISNAIITNRDFLPRRPH